MACLILLILNAELIFLHQEYNKNAPDAIVFFKSL